MGKSRQIGDEKSEKFWEEVFFLQKKCEIRDLEKIRVEKDQKQKKEALLPVG